MTDASSLPVSDAVAREAASCPVAAPEAAAAPQTVKKRRAARTKLPPPPACGSLRPGGLSPGSSRADESGIAPRVPDPVPEPRPESGASPLPSGDSFAPPDLSAPPWASEPSIAGASNAFADPKTADRSASSVDPAAPRPEFVEAALEWLRRGWPDLQILTKLRAECRCAPIEGRACLDEAYRRLRESFAARTTAERLALAAEQRATLAALAYEGGDYRIALSAMESRDKLLGLGDADPEENVGVTNLLRLAELARRSANQTDDYR